MQGCTWKKEGGRYVCMAKHCPHWNEGSCLLGKVTLSCDNQECTWNIEGHNQCKAMDVHLDADGKCFGFMRNSHAK